MQPIGYADHLKVYHIKHDINDYVYFRFCNGKMKRARIQNDENGDAFFMIENTLKYYFSEILRIK